MKTVSHEVSGRMIVRMLAYVAVALVSKCLIVIRTGLKVWPKTARRLLEAGVIRKAIPFMFSDHY